MFIAWSTGDAVWLSELQAEPVETQMPRSSRAASIISPFVFSKEMFDVFGSRAAGSDVPFKREFGILSKITDSSRSRSDATRDIADRSETFFAAAPIPAI